MDGLTNVPVAVQRTDWIHYIGAVLLWAAPFVFSSCQQSDVRQTEAVTDRQATPILDVDSVTTLISDSGVVRYRISAPRWQIYDKAEPSYWEFMQGIYLEEFDELLRIQASLRADYARYWDKEERWELTGNVHALNEKGEAFDTELLIWDQHAERVFSDSAITITRDSSVIRGIGFESNQTMTNYTILNPTGYFTVDE